jgi:phosphoribosylformylglycinamidine cyclo-ligase
MPNQTTPLDYKTAGVNIDAGNELVNRIKPLAKSTHIPGVLGGLGGFGGLFALDLQRYKQPILVSTTDGVGSKLCLSTELQRFDTIGIDLVAMCVNDIIVCGAKPLFFLDYFATGHLDVEHGYDIVSGIAKGCKISGAALLGGETAEMPGLYHGEDYDLAGFCVGIVEREQMMQASQVSAGDVIIGLASDGVHSNGFSLVRKIIEVSNSSLNTPFMSSTLGHCLLTPTRIYVAPILKALEQLTITAMAHITGGGLLENIPRVLPQGVNAQIQKDSWTWPDIFTWLQQKGNVETSEMLRTFNCGIGYVVIVARSEADKALQLFDELGEKAYRLGEIVSAKENAAPEVIFS